MLLFTVLMQCLLAGSHSLGTLHAAPEATANDHVIDWHESFVLGFWNRFNRVSGLLHQF